MTAPIPHQQHDSLITRRSIFLGAAASLIFAPAIVPATNLMPVRGFPLPFDPQYAGYCERLFFHALDNNLMARRMSTILNGKMLPASQAQRIVARARAYGWIPPCAARPGGSRRVSRTTIA